MSAEKDICQQARSLKCTAAEKKHTFLSCEFVGHMEFMQKLYFFS